MSMDPKRLASIRSTLTEFKKASGVLAGKMKPAANVAAKAFNAVNERRQAAKVQPQSGLRM